MNLDHLLLLQLLDWLLRIKQGRYAIVCKDIGGYLSEYVVRGEQTEDSTLTSCQ